MKYHIYIDGSSRGNPGKGGWGLVVMNEDETSIIMYMNVQDEGVTNNQMELKALLAALQFAEDNPRHSYVIYSDSAYTVNSYNEWLRGWACNNWKNSKGLIVENLAIMQALYPYRCRSFFNAYVVKCSGHSGDVGNELADALATNNKKKFNSIVEDWNLTVEDYVE